MREERLEISTEDLKLNREEGVNVHSFHPNLVGIRVNKVVKSEIDLIIHLLDK